ncbi:hypothetical protein niasHS_001706 [Heterodera schachtii]|uniref:RING-type E3 ubiquitin transferase (cysteine targeting) n=1 Tax=Heterodera schachtii TaxID=97005 RepID=A0ABD2KCH7_HETSC
MGKMKNGEDEFGALRAVQIDAALLDNNLLALIQARIDQIVDTAGGAHCLQQYKQHFRECIAPLYFLSHFLAGQTPGQRLLQIRTNFPTTIKALLNYLLCFLLPSFVAIIIKLRPFDRRIQLWYSRAQTAHRLVDFIHFCLFLAQGGPIRPTERLLGSRPVYVQKPTIGSLNFTALNRELLGHSFVQLCFLFVPLFNVLKRRFLRALSRRRQQHFCRDRHNANKTTTANAAVELNGQPPSVAGIVWCTECGQSAISAVRAKRRTQQQQNGRKVEEEEWKTYCHFCLFQSDTFGTDGSKCQWEMLTLDNKQQ